MLILPGSSFALKVNDSLPELTGTDLSGKQISLSQFKGQPILLKVGTTWCPTCSQQNDEIEKIRAYLKENNVHFIDVFVQETDSSVQRYLNKSSNQPPDVVILDKGKIARALNLYLIPRLILVDKNFKVFRDGDPVMAEPLKKQLEQMLIEK